MKIDKEFLINRLAYIDRCIAEVMLHNIGKEDYKVLQKASKVVDCLNDYVRHPDNGHYGVRAEE